MLRFLCARITGFVSVILAFFVLSCASWTLANTFRQEFEAQSMDSGNKMSIIPESNFTDRTHPPVNENHTVRDVDDAPIPKLKNSDHGLWNSVSNKYKLILQSCIGVSVFTAAIQLIISVILLGTSSKVKYMYSRARIWVISHFVVIIILSSCVLIPLSYNREKDSFRGAKSFGKYIKKGLKSLYEMFEQEQDTENFILKLFQGSNLYFTVLSCDIGIIVIMIIIVSSCCICIYRNNNYE